MTKVITTELTKKFEMLQEMVAWNGATVITDLVVEDVLLSYADYEWVAFWNSGLGKATTIKEAIEEASEDSWRIVQQSNS